MGCGSGKHANVNARPKRVTFATDPPEEIPPEERPEKKRRERKERRAREAAARDGGGPPKPPYPACLYIHATPHTPAQRKHVYPYSAYVPPTEVKRPALPYPASLYAAPVTPACPLKAVCSACQVMQHLERPRIPNPATTSPRPAAPDYARPGGPTPGRHAGRRLSGRYSFR